MSMVSCPYCQYPLKDIGNMDKTPLTFDIIPNMMVARKGSRTIIINLTGHEKSNFTCVLRILADGTKLPVINIFKLKKMPHGTWPQDVSIRVNTKGWMNEIEMLWWIRNI